MARSNPVGLFPALDSVGNALVSTQLGCLTASVPSSAGNVVISNTPGRLAKVLVTTAGTGAGNVLFYDNATTNTGTIIGIVAATISVTGTPLTFDIPAANGIVCAQVASGPVFTVSYQ
jgi:hypothetical protein